jgi:hypothetical protein
MFYSGLILIKIGMYLLNGSMEFYKNLFSGGCAVSCGLVNGHNEASSHFVELIPLLQFYCCIGAQNSCVWSRDANNDYGKLDVLWIRTDYFIV